MPPRTAEIAAKSGARRTQGDHLAVTDMVNAVGAEHVSVNGRGWCRRPSPRFDSPPRTRAEKPPNVTSTVARSSGLATSRLASVCERPDRRLRTARRRGGPVRPGRGPRRRPAVRSAEFPALSWLAPSGPLHCPELNPHCPESARPGRAGRCPTGPRRCGRSVASRRATARGYIAPNSPARATEPAGTAVRGSDRRGTRRRGSPSTRYAKPGAKPLNPTRHSVAVWASMTCAVVSPVWPATSARSGPS